MLWTGPWDLSSINSDVKYGVTYLPGFNGNHETISGPDLYMLFDHSGARADAAFDFVTWLTSAKQHIKFSIATGDLPLRQSETTLPGYQTFLKKFPAEKVFVSNLDNVKHVRPNIASYARGVDDHRHHGAVGPPGPGHARRGPELGLVAGRVGAGRLVTQARRRRATILPPRRVVTSPARSGRGRSWQAEERRDHGLGHDQPERRPDRGVRTAAGGLGVPAVVPAQRPPDPRNLGRAGQLPPAGARPRVRRLRAPHRGLHRDLRPDHPGAVAPRGGRAQPPGPGDHVLPAGRLRPRRHLHRRHRRDLHLAAGPRLRARERRPQQARPADIRVLRLPRRRALRDRDDDGLGLGRLRCPDLPGRAPGSAAGADRGRRDGRLLAGEEPSGGSRFRCCDR